MKYAVVIQDYYSSDDYEGGTYRVNYDKLKEFDSQEALERYLLDNSEKTFAKETIKKIIQFEELTVERKVTIGLKKS